MGSPYGVYSRALGRTLCACVRHHATEPEARSWVWEMLRASRSDFENIRVPCKKPEPA